MGLTEYDALRAYAKALNTLDIEPLEGLLADDFTYDSQMVLQALKSKQEFLDYMIPKLETIARHDATVYAEMGVVGSYGHSGRKRPCVIIAQDDKENLLLLAFARVEGDKLKGIHLCVVPEPATAERSGDYPT